MDEPTMPPAWARAVTLFTDGYGDPPDFEDPTDVIAFQALLREEIVDEWQHQFVEYFKRETAKMQQVHADLEGK